MDLAEYKIGHEVMSFAKPSSDVPVHRFHEENKGLFAPATVTSASRVSSRQRRAPVPFDEAEAKIQSVKALAKRNLNEAKHHEGRVAVEKWYNAQGQIVCCLHWRVLRAGNCMTTEPATPVNDILFENGRDAVCPAASRDDYWHSVPRPLYLVDSDGTFLCKMCIDKRRDSLFPLGGYSGRLEISPKTGEWERNNPLAMFEPLDLVHSPDHLLPSTKLTQERFFSIKGLRCSITFEPDRTRQLAPEVMAALNIICSATELQRQLCITILAYLQADFEAFVYVNQLCEFLPDWYGLQLAMRYFVLA